MKVNFSIGFSIFDLNILQVGEKLSITTLQEGLENLILLSKN